MFDEASATVAECSATIWGLVGQSLYRDTTLVIFRGLSFGDSSAFGAGGAQCAASLQAASQLTLDFKRAAHPPCGLAFLVKRHSVH